MPQWIGLLENDDVSHTNVIKLDGNKPVEKAILLVFMPDCPHCKHPKRQLQKLNVRRHNVEKLAIDASMTDGLSDRVPKIFGFPKDEYTVPRIYVIQNGRPIKQLKSVEEFDPVHDFKVPRAPARIAKPVAPAKLVKKSIRTRRIAY